MSRDTTYHHAEPDLLATVLLLHGVIEDDIQENL